MGPMLFVMAILGCGDGDGPCQEVRVSETLYPSARLCEAAIPKVLGRNLDLDYPTIIARCRAESAEDARKLLASRPHG